MHTTYSTNPHTPHYTYHRHIYNTCTHILITHSYIAHTYMTPFMLHTTNTFFFSGKERSYQFVEGSEEEVGENEHIYL